VTRQLRWTEQAVEQLGAIADYISLSSPVYAEAVVERVAMRVESALTYPDIGSRVPEFDAEEIRQLIEWPYRIIYRRHPDAIEVLAIVHGRRDLLNLEQR
jgi:toxin ParE1/3/4